MAQTVRPISDVALGNWVPTPASPATGFDKIDEVTPVDTDYVSSPLAPVNEAYRVRFGSATDPLTNTGHFIRYRIRKNLSGGAQMNAVVRLDENGTQRASWSHTDVTNTWTTFEQELTTGEADSITDYTVLELRSIANQV